MFGKILTGLLILVLVASIFSLCLGFANKARIERLERVILASQEQEKEFAPKFQGLSVASVEQAKRLGVLSAIPETKIVPVEVGEVVSKKYRWRIPALCVVIAAIIVLYRKKIISWFKKFSVKVPVILLAGLITFSLAGFVSAADDQNKKPSVYQGIYDTLSNQNKSIGKLSEWQSGFTSSQAIFDQAKKYTDQEIKKLPKEKAQKPATVEQKVSVVRVEKPKPDFSVFAQQRPNVNRLWGNPISVVAEKSVEPELQQPVSVASKAEEDAKAVLAEADKVLGKKPVEEKPVEVKPQQPGNPQTIASATETDAQKIQRLEQEKAQTEARLKDSEKQVKTLQEQNTKAVSNDEERKKECKPTRFLVGGRFYR